MRDRPRPAGIPAQPGDLAEHDVQALALDVLHGVVVDPLVLAHDEDRDDVGVVQEGGGLGLAPEPDQLDRDPICRSGDSTFNATCRPRLSCTAS